MARGSNQGGASTFWWIFILFMVFGGGAVLPLLFIVGVVMAIMFAAVGQNRKNDTYSSYASRPQTTSSYRRTRYTAAQMAKINVYLRRWFRSHQSLSISRNVDLRIRGTRYASLASLDVYRDNTFICTLNDFGKRYPDSYDEILSELVRLSESQNMNDDVFEAEVTPVVTEVKKEDRKQEKQEVKTETAPRKTAQKYMEEISRLNDDIPDENISNGLYETCALLKQIQTLEERFPNSRNKLDKLYEYYLPILIRILKQYDNLQAAQTDPSYEETKAKLNRTLTLINDAMKTIISSMTDADFINLSADISTLEAVLQKDGLTKDSQIMPRTYGGQGED